MPRRIVVTLASEARCQTASVATALARDLDMRVGFAMPANGRVVGEVTGDIEVGRIRAMSQVEDVREQARDEGRRVHA